MGEGGAGAWAPGAVTWANLAENFFNKDVWGNITVANILAILAGGAAIALIFVLMWWGVRKVTKMLMGAFRKGRLSV